MILPFYTDISYQEFRKFADDQDLLRQIKFYSNIEAIPAFVFETGRQNANITATYIVYVDDYGFEISRTELINNEVFLKFFNGHYLYVSVGENVGFEFEYCKYYIEINDSENGVYYSEILTKIREQKADARLKLNTNAYFLLNSGGYILLNTSQDGFILDELTKIEAETSRNYNSSDFSNIKLTYYCDTRPYLEEHFEVTEEEDNAGEITVFQKVITSVYSLNFFAVGSVMANLENLAFFDNIIITDPEGRQYNVLNRPEISRAERVGTSGVYRCTIIFRTEYRIDLQLIEQITNDEDEDMISRVGVINYTPSQKSLVDFLSGINTILANSGFQAVACNGGDYDPDTHPIATIMLGTKDILGVARVFVPDTRGLAVVGSGSFTDNNGDSESFTSASVKTEGVFKHKLDATEMTHLHVTGGRKDQARLAFFENARHNPESTYGAGTGLQLIDDLLYKNTVERFSDSQSQETTVFSTNVDNKDLLITSRNDKTTELKTERTGHNNIQPCIGAHCWTIIDDPS